VDGFIRSHFVVDAEGKIADVHGTGASSGVAQDAILRHVFI